VDSKKRKERKRGDSSIRTNDGLFEIHFMTSTRILLLQLGGGAVISEMKPEGEDHPFIGLRGVKTEFGSQLEAAGLTPPAIEIL